MRALYRNTAERTWQRPSTLARLERAVLFRALRLHAGAEPRIVIDVGGGNGAYSFAMAAQGHYVHLCDLTPELISDARRRDEDSGGVLASIALADARSLPYEDELADLGLLFGPIYGIPTSEGRIRALTELARVLRPGGIGFVQVLTRIGGVRFLQALAPDAIVRIDWRGFLASGLFGEEDLPPMLTSSCWLTTEQVRVELERSSLVELQCLMMDGPAPSACLRDTSEDALAAWAELLGELSGDPTSLGLATTLLFVVQRPAG